MKLRTSEIFEGIVHVVERLSSYDNQNPIRYINKLFIETFV